MGDDSNTTDQPVRIVPVFTVSVHVYVHAVEFKMFFVIGVQSQTAAYSTDVLQHEGTVVFKIDLTTQHQCNKNTSEKQFYKN